MQQNLHHVIGWQVVGDKATSLDGESAMYKHKKKHHNTELESAQRCGPVICLLCASIYKKL